MVYYYLDIFGVIFLPCRLLWHFIILSLPIWSVRWWWLVNSLFYH